MVEGELRSYERVHNAVRGVELVFHLGALRSVPRSVQDPLTTSAVNVEGTLNVLLAARDEGVRRVVFASSSSVYGNRETLPLDETSASRPDLAVRGREARGRALLRQLQPRLRVLRDRRRSATSTSSGRARSPHSEYAAVVPRFITAIAVGRAGDDLRRRRAVARLHVRRNVVDATPRGRRRRPARRCGSSTSPPASRRA